MCYQESRYHAICSHTIHARVECPQRCVLNSVLDKVEMQLPAYCNACRRHVDSQGIISRYRNSNSYSRRRSSSSSSNNGPFSPIRYSKRISSNLPQDASARALAGSVSMESLRLAAASPPPATPLPTPPRVPLPPWALANTDARRSLTDRTPTASMGAMVKGFAAAREQEEREEESRPKMLSPIPQKPVLNLRIPEESTTVSYPPTTTSTKSDSAFSTSQPERASSASSSDDTEATTELQQTTTHSSLTPTTTQSPSSPVRKSSTLAAAAAASSLDAEPSSKPPRAPLPQLPPINPIGPLSLLELRRSLRRTSSSAKLLGAGSKSPPLKDETMPTSLAPQQQQRPGSPLLPDTIATTTMTNRKMLLRRSKSSRTLAEELAAAQRAAVSRPADLKTGPVSPSVAAAALFSPALPEVRKRIDIHDPAWLAKHGLKWDAHGLGAAV